MEIMRRLGSVERTWKMIGGAVAALTLVFTAVAVSGSSAEAAEPTAVRVLEHTLPATDFNILCEGETNEDPSVSGPDAFPDLTSVSGARLAAYNEGELVVLYTAEGLGRFAYPPLCAVRHVDGVGAVAEWMFCTDMFANVCGDIRDDGLLMENEDPPRVLQATDVSNPRPVPSNTRLNADQEKLIAWLLQNEHDFTGFGFYEQFGAPTAAVTQGTGERWAMQTFVWCVSDLTDELRADDAFADFVATCDASFSPERQAELLESFPEVEHAHLTLTPLTQGVLSGQIAHVTLSSNAVGVPIRVTTDADTVLDLCDESADAELNGHVLTLGESSDGDVELCLQSTGSGEVNVYAELQLADTAYLSWNQSDPVVTGTVECQVYSTWESHRASFATQARVVVNVLEPREGTFTLQKQLEGIEAGDFPEGTVFPVTVTWDGGERSFELPADGSVVESGLLLPEGTVGNLVEGALPEAPEGFVFDAARVSSPTITIYADDNSTISWTLTNIYREEVPEVPVVPEAPVEPATPVEPDAPGTPEKQLAVTGASDEVAPALMGGALVAVGALFLVLRQRGASRMRTSGLEN